MSRPTLIPNRPPTAEQLEDLLHRVWVGMTAFLLPQLQHCFEPRDYLAIAEQSMLTLKLDAVPAQCTLTAALLPDAEGQGPEVWAMLPGSQVPAALVETAAVLVDGLVAQHPDPSPELREAMQHASHPHQLGEVVVVAHPATGELRAMIVTEADPRGPGVLIGRVVPASSAAIRDALQAAMVAATASGPLH